ncbi:MAG: carbamoyltransferase HypF [Chthoniobacter sp.]|nr:carbamoyltransferase HypF [Chthoniobacter sp.]
MSGTVQGVGFRPFVHRLAAELGVAGWVRNAMGGVEIEIEGEAGVLDQFVQRLRAQPPPSASIVALRQHAMPPAQSEGFQILDSTEKPTVDARPADIVPDLATCANCLSELFDPADRRFEYAFINCTHCGPRFSIVLELPYDRDRTTMRGFAMCTACRAEYESPENRRFHAQPNACAQCGPQLTWLDASGNLLASRGDALAAAVRAIEDGRIIAVKGIGGFHLIADARNETVIATLRKRKHRPAKPFAVMMPSLAMAREEVAISDAEAAFLTAPSAPIVILRRRADSSLPSSLAPGNPTLGILLPHSPLHHLLMRRLGFPVIATSGNVSEEPICIDNGEAVSRLRGIADGFLVHDRPIARPVDDSVMRFVAGRDMLLRRSRGFAPAPVMVPGIDVPVLGCGGDLKGTVAVTDAGRVRLSQHLGDLASVESRRTFEHHLAAFPDLAGARLEAIACDSHPGYHSRAAAESKGLPLVTIQHHHAHAIACAAENGINEDEEFLAVVWDGTGFGTDGTIWGGEFLICRGAAFRRFAWLRPFPLPGGEKAVRDPRFAAMGCLHLAGIPVAQTSLADLLTAEEQRVATALIERRAHAPLCSSAGRLFDAVAALCGLCRRNEFEGQAAMALEFAATSTTVSPDIDPPALPVDEGGPIDWTPLLQHIVKELAEGAADIPTIAHHFHVALADTIVRVARQAAYPSVVLSGGCFQNALLTELVIASLRTAGYLPIWHRHVPPNDGGIALGQAVIASRLLRAQTD